MSKANPKQEWGFYAVTPRIVRTHYKQLSHTEKWLYVCLKDLCGDKGMCYRTLKALSQETDLSTGNLSTGIRHLHEAGLIHAEKKRRSANPTAKEVWHISIVDIWQANVECSKYERYEENVQTLNDNLQSLNEPPLERSENEQQRSNFVDRRITLKNNNTEVRTSEEERVANATSAHALSDTDTSQQGDADESTGHRDERADLSGHADEVRAGTGEVLLPAGVQVTKGDTDATSTLPAPDPLHAPAATGNHLHRVEDRRAPAQAEAPVTRSEQTPFPVTSPQNGAVGSAPQSSGPRASGRRGKPQQQDVTQATLPPAPKFHLTEAEEQFWGLWCHVWFNKDIPPDLNDTAYKHVVKLAPHIKTAEQLDSLIKRAKKDLEDSQGLKRKTVFLGNLVTSYSGWKQEQKPPEQPKPKQEAPMQPLPVLRVLPPDRSKSPRLRSPAQTVGRA